MWSRSAWLFSKNREMVCLLGLLAGSLMAQPPPRPLADPPPEEVELDLARRLAEWRASQLATSRKKQPGWTVRTTGPLILVVSRGISSSRNVTHMTNLALAVRKWLGRNFAGISRTRPGKAVIRICATSAEEQAWRRGQAGPFIWPSNEIVVTHALGQGLLEDFRLLAQGLTRHDLEQQRSSLWVALPEWLASGLPAHLTRARLTKRFGFIFEVPRSPWRSALTLMRRGTLIPVLDLVCTPHEELIQVRRNSLADCQLESELLARFLTWGRGRKGSSRGFIPAILSQLQADLETLELLAWKDVMKQEAVLERRPDAHQRFLNFEAFQKRLHRFQRLPQQQREKLWSTACAAAFSKWKPERWRKLDLSFRAWIKKGLRRP